MSNMYIALEAMSSVVLLILLYANLFEEGHKSRKRQLFTQLLISNTLVVITDAVTWIDLGWKEKSFLFGALLTVTYVLPLLLLSTFARYIYEHIREKTEVSRKPFAVIAWFSFASGILTLLLCITERMFTITEGHYSETFLSLVYSWIYVVALTILSVVIIRNYVKLGLHDTLAALTFCLVPLASILISISPLQINLAIPAMSINMLVIYIMLQAEQESKLFKDSNIDELTGLFNRRAYEDDRMNYPKVPQEPDFIYASIDVNGLKQVNDTFGHAAGDELLCGAAYCLKRTFGNYGKVYRTGGDEFTSMFFADEGHYRHLIEDLKELTSQWHGESVDSLALSVGCAEKREFPAESVDDLAKIADQRMYKEKEKYYAKKGVDRRGQNEAHKVLCSLYSKILKIDITNDTFSIVNMNIDEQTKDLGYADKISTWLEDFGRQGGVHPDDLEAYLSKTNIEYMRGYFKRGKTSLTVLYRRKYSDGYKQVVMEIIPAADYSDDNQSLFLYVKNIDL